MDLVGGVYWHTDWISEDRFLLPYILFPDNNLNILRHLITNESQLAEAIISGNIDLLAKLVDDAVNEATERFNEEKEKLYDRFDELMHSYDEIFSELVNSINEIDETIADIPDITRDSLTLYVEGKLANYKVGLWSGEALIACKRNHEEYRHLCVNARGDIRRLGERGDVSDWIKKPLQTALSLVNEEDIEDPYLFRRISEAALCPYCLKEGVLSQRLLDIILSRRKEMIEDDEYCVY